MFTEEQLALLKAPLPVHLVSERKGGGNKMLKYIEGHTAIDQGNKIFGHGNWTFRPLSCEQVVLFDPLTGEAVGVAYKAKVELIVRDCVAPVVEVGSQPVVTWNVEDYVMKRRLNDAKYNKKPLDETSPFTFQEKSQARVAIVDAHEMAEKGAVTDALKRTLRIFGAQFGNDLYGDGRVAVDDDHVPAQSAKPQSPTPTGQISVEDAKKPGSITQQQLSSIAKLCEHLGKSVPAEANESMSFLNARTLIQTLTTEYKQKGQKQQKAS
jgi:recombination DNA repair RAD52 pathway protein